MCRGRSREPYTLHSETQPGTQCHTSDSSGPSTWIGVEGSYLRPIDSCVTQLKAQGPSTTCNESKEEEDEVEGLGVGVEG